MGIVVHGLLLRADVCSCIVLGRGDWQVAHVADAMGVLRATAYECLGRRGVEGTAGLEDRISEP